MGSIATASWRLLTPGVSELQESRDLDRVDKTTAAAIRLNHEEESYRL